MSGKYPEYKRLSLPSLEKTILQFWDDNNTFEQSVTTREGNPTFTFYEGPPSANGTPGIHHVLSRTIKDIFCRYKTLMGFQVKRKGGWDTHGLPVELKVEKRLGITKDQIGKTISVKDYNAACREDVLRYKDQWDDLTRKMGYWVDLENPYVTFENPYIESVWHLLKRLFDKDYLYKGFTIQPYSPAAGTGLSSHELNQPGTYKSIKDVSCTAQFKSKSADNEYFLAWTTTPWTLPANTALAVGKNIVYVKVKTFNAYTHLPITVILAEKIMDKYFSKKAAKLKLEDYKPGDKRIPFEIVSRHKGSELAGTEYEQLLPYVQPDKPAFRVIVGDFVSTEDGTGIVHIAPTFGADDFRVAAQNDIPPILVKDEEGNPSPLVDKQGRFVKEVTDFAGRYVKDYGQKEDRPVDVDIVIKLKKENKAFKSEKYEHNYPHCWRTDRPILYYPLNSWFIRTTAAKQRLIELNKTINWKPASTGSGRFGNWLENLVDWNLSRSRYWGIPLPIWRSEDKQDGLKCIGSIAELRTEMERSVAHGFITQDFFDAFFENLDLHKPNIDDVILVSDSGKPMMREPDLIDVWFDSGAMPFAQWHYPFENQETFNKSFPADFIAEGVDQTRGWFFTLHAIAVMLENSVAYKNVIANGLVLDKDGNKMSKRLGNAVDPFSTIETYGADATRWYMIGNAAPWENLRFNMDGVKEAQRKYFGTLFNSYNFFALYANIVGFVYGANEPTPVADRSELDRWIISKLNSLVKEVGTQFDSYEPTRALRQIDSFVIEELSNWYVRLSRRRFWAGDTQAFETLYECLHTVAILMSPLAPFFSERLFQDLNNSAQTTSLSVHLTTFPEVKESYIDLALEERMQMAQSITSLIRSIRRREKLKIRQPLAKAMVAAMGKEMREQLDLVKDLIAAEVNVKDMVYITEDNSVLIKKVKPNFRKLGPKVGKLIKLIVPTVNKLSQSEIRSLEKEGKISLDLKGQAFDLLLEDVEILSQDIPGWAVASDGRYTVALDLSLTDDLRNEGIARELVNRIQNLRKDKGFEVTDRINITITENPYWDNAIKQFSEYIQTETLTGNLVSSTTVSNGDEIEINENVGQILIERRDE